MTPTFDIDKAAVELLPKRHRTPYFQGWVKGLLSQSKRLQGIFNKYINGSADPFFLFITTYAKDVDIIYKKKVYRSLVAGNVGNNPETTTGFWELILNNFVGAIEVSHCNSQKINLEYNLNHFFKQELIANSLPGFIQPNSPSAPTHSSIYIQTAAQLYPTFLIGTTEASSDSISIVGSTGYITLSNVTATASSYIFNVFFPTSVYASIDSNSVIADTIIRNLLDKYVTSGITYNILTY